MLNESSEAMLPRGGCPRRCSSCGSRFASDDGPLKKTICLQAQVALDKGLFRAAVSKYDYYLMKRLSRKPAPFLALVEHDARANSGSSSGDGPLKIVVRPDGDSLKDNGLHVAALVDERHLPRGRDS